MPPRASLTRVGLGGKHELRVWRRRLVNDVAPAVVVIRDDGRFIVTVGEFRRGGAAHALVVYDERGRTLREFDLRELLNGDDWKHVKVERKAVVWTEGAEYSFAEKRPEFLVRLQWGREIRIDLKSCCVTGIHGEGDANANQSIPPEVLALLEAVGERPNGEGNELMTPTQPAEEAALEALRQIAATFGLDLDMAEAAIGALLTNTEGGDAVSGERNPEFKNDFPEEYLTAESDLPLPNPDNPTDYVAWALAQTTVDGGGAALLYEQACAQYQEFDGPKELLDAALLGDSAALVSPEITSWVAAHAEALKIFQETTDYEYRGGMKPGDDYSVIGLILPNLSTTRKLARVSLVHAKMLEANGDTGAAMAEYARTLAVGAQVGGGSTIIENLVGAAVQRETARAMLQSFSTNEGENYDYATAAQLLEDEYQPLRPVAEFLIGERACCYDVLQRVYESDAATGGYRISEQGSRWLNYNLGILGDENTEIFNAAPRSLSKAEFQRMAAEVDRYYDEVAAASELPYQEAAAMLGEIEQRVSSPEFKQRNPIISDMLPALSRYNHLAVEARARRNAARLTTNLKAYKQTHGVYPASLDVFGDSDMILDPFTGGRFVYSVEGDDFSLYSQQTQAVDGSLGDQMLFWPISVDE